MRPAAAALGVLLLAGPGASPTPPEAAGPAAPRWIRVEYGPLLDGERLTQSGETVGALLRELRGAPLPAQEEDSRALAIHRLLDPVLERYAFVLPDAADALAPSPRNPWVEIAALWERGERQPAWVELLRARRFVLESDGAGRLRAFVPVPDGGDRASDSAAERAFRAAWPVLRHPLAAERRRLAGGSRDGAPALEVTVHAYRHHPEATAFDLTAEPLRVTVTDTRPLDDRPPFDLEAVARVLRAPVRLEGGRLDPDGTVRWFTSEAPAPQTLLGAPMELADAAVAYRATFHGGLAEPYMSLDKGDAPWNASVGFGGRLRDTALGTVSLLSDIRFKTFSVGIDPLRDEDLRGEIRARVAGFRTHLERFAAHESTAEVGGQQTRFWFYPDDVEFVLSPSSDVFAIRKARMAAASERVRLGARLEAGGGDPPWTTDLVSSINRDYAAWAELFPELGDLDRTVRLLSAFAWLRAAEAAGLSLPDLDLLLAIELPPVPSPRAFPQLLTRDVLPAPGVAGAVEVLDQSWIAEALDRLRPRNGRFPAERRLKRALDLLDPQDPEQSSAAAEIRTALAGGSVDPTALSNGIDRSERIAMHRRVLSFAPRNAAGQRVFSVGIGGIDLGTSAAFARAARAAAGIAPAEGRTPTSRSAGEPSAAAAPTASTGSRRDDPPGVGEGVMPDHGIGDAPERPAGSGGTIAVRETIRHRFARGVRPAGEGRSIGWTETRLGGDGPDVVFRRRFDDSGAPSPRFVRVEEGRFLSYRLERDGDRLRAVAASPDPVTPDGPPASTANPDPLPAGLTVLEILEGDATAAVGPGLPGDEPESVAIRKREAGAGDRVADLPRGLLRRLILGRRLDPRPTQPLPLFSSPQALMGESSTVLVLLRDDLSRPPWEGPSDPVSGEEDAARIVPALISLWAGNESALGRGAAVAVDSSRSAARWRDAPRGAPGSVLVAPRDAFPSPYGYLREELARAWPEGRMAEEVPAAGPLVVVASAEAPGVLSERLRTLSRSPNMKGRLLAVCSFGGPLRPDLPARLLEDGNLAGIAIAEPSVPAGRKIARELGAWIRAVDGAHPSLRIEAIAGPLVWSF